MTTARAAQRGRPDAQVVLLLTADTGGGHRAAAEAVAQALDRWHPGRFRPVVCDPLTGVTANRIVRRLCRLYGPLVGTAPWLWWLMFRLSNTTTGVRMLRRLSTRSASAPIGAAMARHRPAAVVVLHPLLVTPAAAVRRGGDFDPLLVTVVTDLATAHRSWWDAAVDQVVTPTPHLRRQAMRATGLPAGRCHALGSPVRRQFRAAAPARATMRRTLGLEPDGFVVLVTAGAEGARDLKRWTKAALSGAAGADVVSVCGRNERLRADLKSLSARTGRRLTVTGFVKNMADWMRCADVIVTRAGPGIIAEATACGVPMLLAGEIPGQESGNSQIVVDAGAGRRIRGRKRLARQIGDLQSGRAALDRMSAATVRAARSPAEAEIAALIADQTPSPSPSLPRSVAFVARRDPQPTGQPADER